MTVKIDKKIVGYALVNDESKAKEAELKALNAKVVQIGEPLDLSLIHILCLMKPFSVKWISAKAIVFITGMWMSFQSVSYTHLDVYKRQIGISATELINILQAQNAVVRGGTFESVSYTHLDVYKRQAKLLEISERSLWYKIEQYQLK